jgi:hypothetical protein
MLETEPVKTFRGTWDEVASHRDEIPEGAVVEVRVYVPKPVADEGIGDFGGRSVADMIREIGFIEAEGPSDMARHPEKYMKGFGETKTRRKLSP